MLFRKGIDGKAQAGFLMALESQRKCMTEEA